jgi:hypothetical protein
MANKITFQFTANPAIGFGFSYFALVNGYKIPYSNGNTDVLVNFIALGATEANLQEIAIEATLDLTIEKTLKRLIDTYVNSKVTYTRISNSIEVFINVDSVLELTETNANIEAIIYEVPVIFPDLKYYIKWDNYFLSIRQKNYQGFSTEIFGNVVLKKGNVEEILDPIRGTGLNIDLEANPSLTFDEFLLADEMTYTVQLKKGNKTIFNGFIKPDGVQQSFVYDTWLVNIEAIDGLGALKDLSFVYPNGSQFVGKLSMFDIIRGCLDRTGSLMTINSSIELNYIGYAGTNILKDTYLNSSRFIKNDGTTIMDCNSVLNSVLNLLSAVITQEDGQWWIYRPNDLKQNKATIFINNTTNTTFVKNLDYNLGSQIDGYYPHHCEANQQIEVKGAISAYRLNYEYGFNDGFLTNPYLKKQDSVISQWTKVTSGEFIINDPNDLSGITMIPQIGPGTLTDVLVSELFPSTEGASLVFKANLSSYAYTNAFYFKIKTNTGLYLTKQNTWSTNASSYFIVFVGQGNASQKTTLDYTLELPLIQEDCLISLVICRPVEAVVPKPGDRSGLAEVNYIQIIDETIKKAGKLGEFHTVSRKNPPSSITKENQTVYNGDGSNSLIGSIYKSDKVSLTDLWARKDKFEQYPILRISAEDDLRIKRNPIKVFSGSILGLFPYLSIININNIVGLFMFTEYTYDFRSKVLNAKLTQFYNDELGDMDYLLTYDYGNNTIKPTIKG